MSTKFRICCCVALLVLSCVAVKNSKAEQPNIILINLDDADAWLTSQDVLNDDYPHIARLAADSLRFTNAHVTTPLCGPSRACLLRAQYAHNTGIKSNDPAAAVGNGMPGGYLPYVQNGYTNDDLSVWMKLAGYKTMLVGKYLHNSFDYKIPPGWDDCYISLGAQYYGTRRFTNRESPEGKFEKLEDGVFRTNIEIHDAIELITRHVDQKEERPFFMYLAPFTPHQAAGPGQKMYESKYAEFNKDSKIPVTPDLNEIDFSDKPRPLQSIPRFGPTKLALAQSQHQGRIKGMKSLDDMLEKLLTTLETKQLKQNTYVFLTSDNGYSLGHHRLLGKGDSYQRATNVPLMVIGPNVKRSATANHLIAHIDIGPTIVDIAGGSVPEFVDGRSFKHLLNEPGKTPASGFRKSILIQNWQKVGIGQRQFAQMASTSVRYPDSSYTEWAEGGREFYDLKSDPYQLKNQYSKLPTQKRKQLNADLRALRGNDQSPPISTIGTAFNTSLKVEGLAEDNKGIEGVQVEIKDEKQERFWSGTKWQEEQVQVTARLGQPGGILTTWHCYIKRPADAKNEFEISVSAVAKNLDGKTQRAINKRFSVDSVPPVTKFAFPQQKILKPEDIEIAVTVNDDSPIRSVDLFIQNVGAKIYLNADGKWRPERSSVKARHESGRLWIFERGFPVGRYRIEARSTDRLGNREQKPPILWFEVRQD